MSDSFLLEDEVLEEVSALPESEVEELRRTASNDLYVMAKGVLMYKDVNPNTHGAYCRFIQHAPRKRRLGLMPRTHLKTTIEIADLVRLPTLDVDHFRGLIVGETATLSDKILDEVKSPWRKNQLLRLLYPSLAPQKFSGPGVTWSSTMATLPRNSGHKEPTWQSVGVGGQIIGSHFTRIKADDLIGYEAAKSPAALQSAIMWNNNIESLLVNQHEDIIDWTGTRWSRFDLYNHIMDKYGDELAVFTREAIEEGKIIFPELHTWEEYERIQRISPEVWFAQYCNNPHSTTAAELPVEAVRQYRFSADGNIIEAIDANGQEIRVPVASLDRVVLCDPNSGSPTAPDEAAIICTGMDSQGNVFVLFAWSGRLSPSEYVDRIIDVCAHWRPRAVGIEQAGQQTSLHYFEQKRASLSFHLPIPEPLKPKNKDKPTRIRENIEPVIRSARLFLNPSQTGLHGQIAQFPDLLLFDQIDALAYGPLLWRKPLDTGTMEKSKRNLRFIMTKRHSRTGY